MGALCAGCSSKGTFVHLHFAEEGAALTTATGIDVSLQLDGKSATATFKSGASPFVFPSDAVLEIRDGAGLLTASAEAKDASGATLAMTTADGQVTVVRDHTVDLNLTFSGVGSDMGLPDLSVVDLSTADGASDAGPDLIELAPLLRFAAASYDFGAVASAGTSATIDFTVTNQGGGPSQTLVAAALTGANAAQFTLVHDGCVGFTLNPGASCAVSAAFTPKVTGPATANLTVGDGAASALESLAGDSVGLGTLVFTGTPYDFGSVQIGATSSKTITLRNSSNTTASSAITVSLSGGSQSAYAISNDSCTNNPLAPLASCSFLLTFAPVAPGGVEATSLLASAATGGPGVGQVQGQAAAPAQLVVSPATFDFKTVMAGMTADQSFTVSDVGDEPSTPLNPLQIGGSSWFSIVNDTCSGATLTGSGGGANSSCTYTVRFTPKIGKASGSVIASASNGGSATAQLAGTGEGTATLTVTNPGGGLVTSEDTIISCGASCTESFAAVVSPPPIVLMASPSPGLTFERWTGDCTGTTPSCTVSVNVNTSVTAVFDVPVTVNVTTVVATQTTKQTPGNGNHVSLSTTSTTCSGNNCSLKAPYGSSETFTAVPGLGEIGGVWSGDCSATAAGAPCTLTMNGPHTVTQQFLDCYPNDQTSRTDIYVDPTGKSGDSRVGGASGRCAFTSLALATSSFNAVGVFHVASGSYVEPSTIKLGSKQKLVCLDHSAVIQAAGTILTMDRSAQMPEIDNCTFACSGESSVGIAAPNGGAPTLNNNVIAGCSTGILWADTSGVVAVNGNTFAGNTFDITCASISDLVAGSGNVSSSPGHTSAYCNGCGAAVGTNVCN